MPARTLPQHTYDTPPAQCPKCGCKEWSKPLFRGAIGWLSSEDIQKAKVLHTLDDGRKLIDKGALYKLSVEQAERQRLEYHCKACEYPIHTPTLDAQENATHV